MKPGKRRVLPDRPWDRMLREAERLKAAVRAKGEHAFHVVKNLFGHRKTRDRGIEKNQAHLETLFALANLVLAQRWLRPKQGVGAP